MRTTIGRWGRGLVALAALTALAACTLGREPAYDAAVAGEVTGLTAGTLRLFQDLVQFVAYRCIFPKYQRDLLDCVLRTVAYCRKPLHTFW